MTARNNCTPEQKAACPLTQHFTDLHHLAYPRRGYRTTLERHWRGLKENKVDICRALHDAIHASGYVPEKPSRQEMASELWEGKGGERAIEERIRQLEIGQLFIRENGNDSVDMERGVGLLPPDDSTETLADRLA